jgi:hypothetical protein
VRHGLSSYRVAQIIVTIVHISSKLAGWVEEETMDNHDT